MNLGILLGQIRWNFGLIQFPFLRIHWAYISVYEHINQLFSCISCFQTPMFDVWTCISIFPMYTGVYCCMQHVYCPFSDFPYTCFQFPVRINCCWLDGEDVGFLPNPWCKESNKGIPMDSNREGSCKKRRIKIRTRKKVTTTQNLKMQTYKGQRNDSRLWICYD